MTEALNNQKFKQIVQKFDPRNTLVRAWALTGGVSAQVTALEVAGPDGGRQKMIVRQHGAVDRRYNPQIAADEFKLLRVLQMAGLAAPKPYLVDQSGEIFPTPYIVVEYIDGEPEFAPANLSDFTGQLAAQLAQIHRIDGTLPELAFLPRQHERATEHLRERPDRLDDSIEEGRIRDTLEAAWPLAGRNRNALLHGDFWPGNFLWKDGRLAGVIDWEDALVGDPMGDLGDARLEMVWSFGMEAMQLFTQAYQSINNTLDYADLPYWDLYAALHPAFKISEWAADAAAEKVIRERHLWFRTQAFEALASR